MPFSREDKILIKHYHSKGYGRRKIRKMFPEKQWTDGGLNSLLKRIKKKNSIERKSGSGLPRSICTEDNIEIVSELILSQEGNPGTHLSQRKISKRTGINRSTVQRISSKILKLKSFRKVKCQCLSERQKDKRRYRCRKLLQRLKSINLARTFFTDEKIFTIEGALNSQNNRVYAKSKSDLSNVRVHNPRSAFPKSVMVSGGISNMGKTSIHFVHPGAKINSQYYCHTLLSAMLPEMNEIGENDYIFMQDGARAHTSKYSLQFLRDNTPELLEPEMWPPNSPDLNPMDYGIWGVMEAKMDFEKINNLDELKRAIVEAWNSISQETIDKIIGSFRKRLRHVILEKGGPIQRFKL